MTYLSVCSGIEAVSVAWDPLGLVASVRGDIADILEEQGVQLPLLDMSDMTPEDVDEALSMISSGEIGGDPC